MTTGRKPKPTSLRLLNGNAGRRPINKKEPRIEPRAPQAPECLSGDARTEWDRVCGRLVASGIMTELDAGALAAYCQAYGRWVEAERVIAIMAERDVQLRGLMIRSAKGNHVPNPLIWIANAAMKDMVRYAAEFGMTPSAVTYPRQRGCRRE